MKNSPRWFVALLVVISLVVAGWWIAKPTRHSRSARIAAAPRRTPAPAVRTEPQTESAAAKTSPAPVSNRQPRVSLPAEIAAKLNEELREKPRYDEPDKALEYYRLKRLPAGEKEIPVEKYLAAKAQMEAMPQYSTAQNRFLPSRNELKANRIEANSEALGTWTPLGPGNIGGRTRALLIHPTSPNVMYAAGVAGGVWKTTLSGALWQPLNDLMANLAVTCLTFDPGNPNTIYAGTGEGFFNSDGVRGAGIFRTTDGGTTWAQLSATSTSDFYYVNDIVVSNANPQHLYAGTRTGVWRSLDGGATWGKVLNYTDGCLDLVIRTDQATDYVFAACGTFGGGEIFRNTDAGGAGAWTSVQKETGMGRTSLALAPSNQNVIYALSANTLSGTFRDGLFAVFRSTNSGDSGTWTAQVRNNNPLKLNTMLLTNPLGAFRSECGLGPNSFGNQGWYDNVIAVDPLDANRVWAGGIDLFRSDDGGANWGIASYWWPEPSVPQYAHADQHTIVFHPNYNGTTNKQMFVGNDGGVFRTDDARAFVIAGVTAPCNPAASGVRWTALNNNYGVTQFYHGAVFPDGKGYFGGTQDNGTLLGTDSTGVNGWREIWGGDGGYVAIDPANPQVLYASTPGGGLRKSTDGGNTFGRVNWGSDGTTLFITPLGMDASDAQRLWTGGNLLRRSLNGGARWEIMNFLSGSLSAVAVAPSDSNYVLAGTSAGYIHRTDAALAPALRGGNNWPSNFPRTGFVSWLTFDPYNKNIAYATYSTFDDKHVWRSTDAGLTWTAIDGSGVQGLPNIPVHCLVVDPNNTARLYVGTDLGVFASLDGGATWAVENSGFANTPVEALALNTVNGVTSLYAFTHGRGVWRITASNAACAYTLAATGQRVTAEGGTHKIQLSTTSGACSWSANSNANWIVLTAGSTGSGNGAVDYYVAPNPAPTSRLATISVIGKTFVVEQEGKKDTEPPIVKITEPTAASTYRTSSSTVVLKGTATDSSGIASLSWQNDRGSGDLITVASPWTISNLSLSIGKNTITILARDQAGNTSRAEVTLEFVPEYAVATLAGGGSALPGTDGPAKDARFNTATSLVVDGNDNIYVTDAGDHRVRKITPAGNITTIAGTGMAGFSGDGGLATAATLNAPSAIRLDKAGNIYISDYNNYRIRKITPDGIINTVVGSGIRAQGGDTNANIGEGVPALQAKLYGVVSLKFDPQGNLYFADNWRVRRVNASDGLIRTYAGTGQNGPVGGDGGKASEAVLWAVSDMETDDKGNLYTAEVFFMRKVDSNGIINRFAGNGFYNNGGVCDPYPAGAPALNTCIIVGSITRDPSGDLIFSDYRLISRIDSAGRLYPLAGNGNSNIYFNGVRAIASDKVGTIYYLEDNRVRKLLPTSSDPVSPQLEITEPVANATVTSPYLTLRGTASDNAGIAQLSWKNDRGGSSSTTSTASSWQFLNVFLQPGANTISVTVWDAVGNATTKSVTVIYNPPNTLRTAAGTRAQGFNLESGAGTSVQLNLPKTVAVDNAGNLYIADTSNHRIRKVTRSGLISTVAGSGQLGSSGDGGLAINAAMNEPNGVVADGTGNLYISDTNNHRIRKVNSAGIITTIAGLGLPGFGGDGGAGTQALFNTPVGLVLDTAGNLLIADGGNHRVRKLNLSTGIITTMAGNGYGFGGDGGQAMQAQLNFPTGVALDQNGNLYIAETSNHQVRKVTPAGVISCYAGAGTRGFSGDGGQATAAQFNAPGGLTVDAAGNLYVTDQGNHRVRKVASDGMITTVAGTGNATSQTSDEGGLATNAALNAPAGVAVDGAGNLFIADTGNHRVVVVAAYKSATTVNGASFATQQPVAPEAIVSVFGANLATHDQTVTQLPLPTELAGTSVKVRDSLGVERLASLFYVGKLQVNYQIPAGTAAGFATVTITNGNGEIFTSAVNVTGVMPGFFTANQNGSGAAAGSVLYVTGPNRRAETAAVCDANGQHCTPRQLDVTAASEVYLELYGTGWRNHSGLANVSVTVGGVAVPVLYAGPQPQFVGLDQLNMQLPRSLAGRGAVDLVLTVDGKAANTVSLQLK